MADEKNKSAFEKITGSTFFKVIVIGFLILILLIPSLLINSLIEERKNYKNNALQDIYQKWGNVQTINGPVLVIPFRPNIKAGIDYAYFLPDKLEISGDIKTEIRYRGIYKAPVYNTELILSGTFNPQTAKLYMPDELTYWNAASIIVGLTDLKGINTPVNILWNQENTIAEAGAKINRYFIESGVQAKIRAVRGTNKFQIKLNINGSSSIYFIPVGKENKVKLSSDWISPSFNGAFLPAKREISKEGFAAEWNVLDYYKTFPQQWISYDWDYNDVNKSKFGVDFFMSVDQYTKTTRSVKYAILFIVLTFIAYFLLIEIINKKRVHAIQYLLVGFALIVFFLLLLSISEHVNFNIAYLISSIAVLIITTCYTYSISKKISTTSIMTSLITGLYVYLFVIIQLEEFSLLIGSIGLFIILAAIMFFTRKINWFNTKE